MTDTGDIGIKYLGMTQEILEVPVCNMVKAGSGDGAKLNKVRLELRLSHNVCTLQVIDLSGIMVVWRLFSPVFCCFQTLILDPKNQSVLGNQIEQRFFVCFFGSN